MRGLFEGCHLTPGASILLGLLLTPVFLIVLSRLCGLLG